MEQGLLSDLIRKLQEPLPGHEAQLKMAHPGRSAIPPAPADVRNAGVMILLFFRHEEWNTVLIQRVANIAKDKHSGQISLPGGKHEKEDGRLIYTALREMEEEIGFPARNVSVIGELTDLYIPVSNFLVHPFVGYTNVVPVFKPDPSEVADIIEVPLSVLLDPQRRQSTSLKINERFTLRNVPYYNVFDRVVWGATAMILSEFLEILKFKI